MRFSLRTLLIVMLLAGPLCAFFWSKWNSYLEWRAAEAARVANAKVFTTARIQLTPVQTVYTVSIPETLTELQLEVERLDREANVTRGSGGILSEAIQPMR